MYARVIFVICVLMVTGTVAQSRRWFSREVSCWITHQKVPSLWEDAQRRCNRDGAILASPLNMPLFNYMQSLINVQNHSSAYFLGTRAKHSVDGQEVLYVSEEGRRLDEMPSAVFDAIDRLDLEQGDCLSMDRHGIRAVSCLDHLPYICYSNETTECGFALATLQTVSISAPTTTPSAPITTTAAPITTTAAPITTTAAPITTTAAPITTTAVPTTTTNSPPPTLTIPGYTYKSATGSFYKFYNQNDVTWYEANAMCARESAQVVVLNNAVEANIIRGIMMDAIGNDNFYVWTGLQYSPATNWRTINGEPYSEVFHMWASSYPQNAAESACALYFGYYSQLFNYSCDNKHANIYFVCEISQ